MNAVLALISLDQIHINGVHPRIQNVLKHTMYAFIDNDVSNYWPTDLIQPSLSVSPLMHLGIVAQFGNEISLNDYEPKIY